MTTRYNIFGLIHKALRAMLYDTALTLQQTDFNNKKECDAALNKLTFVLNAFESHAHKEDNYILPLVSKYDPALVQIIESEHGTDESLTEQMHDKMEALQFVSDEQKIKTGRQLFYLFIEFTGFNLIHMNKEEHVINDILWNHYSDEELQAVTATITAAVPTEEMMSLLPWMMKGITTIELISLINNLQKSMPKETFELLVKKAEDELNEKRWNHIRKEREQLLNN